jgi:hypothetical protein
MCLLNYLYCTFPSLGEYIFILGSKDFLVFLLNIYQDLKNLHEQCIIVDFLVTSNKTQHKIVKVQSWFMGKAPKYFPE